MEYGLIFTAAGLVLNLIVLAVGGTRAIGRLETSLRESIEKSRKEIDERLDSQSREFGETVQAMRQKIHEVEIWSRDNFMRRDGFYKVKDELTVQINGVRDELRKDLRRMEEKLDTKS